MKKIIIFTLLIISNLIFSQGNFNYAKDFEKILKETKKSDSDLNYEKLIVRFQKADTTLTAKQTLALLIGFTDNKNYKPYKDIKFGRKLYEMNDEKKYEEVIRLGDDFLKTHPFDLKTLYETSYAYHKMNNQKIANEYLYKANKIFEAMAFSGYGITMEEPMFALNPADGQDFIRKALRLKIGKMGSGRDKNGYFIDILEVNSEQGSKELYFIIPHATKKMFSE